MIDAEDNTHTELSLIVGPIQSNEQIVQFLLVSRVDVFGDHSRGNNVVNIRDSSQNSLGVVHFFVLHTSIGRKADCSQRLA